MKYCFVGAERVRTLFARLSLVVFVGLASQQTFAQPFLPRTPLSKEQKENSRLPNIIPTRLVSTHFVPRINLDSLLDSERQIRQKAKEDIKKGLRAPLPNRWGIAVSSNIDMASAGTWDELPDGGRLWRLRVVSPGAYSLNFIFNQFYLPEKALFFVYNEDEHSPDMLGAFHSSHNSSNGRFATAPLSGSSAILEYYEPVSARGQGKLRIEKITHGFSAIQVPKTTISIPEADEPNKRLSSKSNKSNATIQYDGSVTNKPCMQGTDVNCTPAYSQLATIKRGVMMIYFPDGYGCTGSAINRVGNTANNVIPYVLTAWHCIDFFGSTQFLEPEDIARAAGAIFRFNYERSSCDGTTNVAYDDYYGCSVISGWRDSDFGLLKLNTSPALMVNTNIYLNGWTRTPASSNLGLPLVSIHHPLADVKKVARQLSTVQGTPSVSSLTGIPYKIYMYPAAQLWDGSSGSPLFNQSKLIIGTYYNGDSNDESCNAGINAREEFGRFDLSWDGGGNANNRLKDYLDPSNSGITSFAGASLNQLWNGGSFVTALPILPISSPNPNEVQITTYPNPVSASGTIAYSLLESSTIKVEVFNTMNQKIGILIEREQQPGYYEETFDLSKYTNGTYTIRFTAVNANGIIQTNTSYLNIIR